MNAYTYEALNLKGQLCKGQVQADNARMARTLLREQTLSPLHVEPLHADRIAPGQAAAHGLQRVLWARAAFGASTLAVWTRQLAGLVTAGLPLERALTALIDEAEEPRQACVGAAQADEQRERRRLAGAVGAEQRHRLTLLDAERETVERRIAAEALDDGVQHGDRLRRRAPGHASATLSQASSVRL